MPFWQSRKSWVLSVYNPLELYSDTECIVWAPPWPWGRPEGPLLGGLAPVSQGYIMGLLFPPGPSHHLCLTLCTLPQGLLD